MKVGDFQGNHGENRGALSTESQGHQKLWKREAWDGEGVETSGMNHLGQSKENIVVKTGSWLSVLVAAGGGTEKRQ